MPARALLLVTLFHELALKGNNRRLFIQTALRNIRQSLSDTPAHCHFVPPMSVRIHAPQELTDTLLQRLRQVIGIDYISPALWTAPSWDALVEAVDLMMHRQPPFASFAVRCKRTDKRFPLTSAELERRLGSYIQQRTGARVELDMPERTFYVRLLADGFYVAVERIPGLGGLPVGVSGRVLALLSGGIDSPVAAWRMMLRGCVVDFVHFHSFPLVSTRSQEKAQALVELLTQYQYRSRLLLVSIADFQRHAVALAPAGYRVVLYRRFMYRVAERLAQQHGAMALVTGESLGQVSSQTLENLATIDAATSLPVLRPLIGMSKQEIIAQARQLGTYELSIQPDEDCCSLFVARHSITRSHRQTVEAFEERLPLEDLLQQTLEQVKLLEYRFPPAPARFAGPSAAAATPATATPSGPEPRGSAS